MLDLYSLITQGQFSLTQNFIPLPGTGWSIIIEEEIIDVPVRRGGGGSGVIYDYKKKKRVYLKVKNENGLVFEKELFLENINLKVQNIQQIENRIIIEVKDPKIENSDKKIKIIPIFD